MSLSLFASASHAGAIRALDANGDCQLVGDGTEYRSYDGSCNNLSSAQWGVADSALLRLASEPQYAADGETPLASDLPSARAVSNAVVAQSESIPDSKGVSSMLMQWGQFLDHDLDLTHVDKTDTMPISIPDGDLHFSGEMGFSRSVFDASSGAGTGQGRQQLNAVSAYIDASQIYGSDQGTADALRTFSGGKLKMTSPAEGSLLDTEMGDRGPMFVSGDERVNEQVGLTAMHTLFSREHNRLATELAEQHPGWDDETLYQETRKLVGGIMQAITYNEFLPVLLGQSAPGVYQGYDDTVDVGITNEFSTAAYRFGHSTLSPELLRLDENYNEIDAGHVALKNAFFNPMLLLDTSNGGIEALLRGLASQTAQAVDPFLIDDVRNMLFGPPVNVGFDLAALNIQRGRDHGLLGFNAMREALGLGKYESWEDAVFMPGMKEALQAVYDSVDDIDLWVGGLAEAHVGDGLLGEVFSAIVLDQFERLRAGDRFWYLNGMFEAEWIAYIEGSTLAEVIARNTGITGLQANVFFVSAPSVGFLLLFGGLLFMARPRRFRPVSFAPARD